MTAGLLICLAGCQRSADINIDFPPANSQFSGAALTVRGQFETGAPDTLEISLSSDNGTLDASIDRDSLTWQVIDYGLDGGIQKLTVLADSPQTLGETEASVSIDTSPNTLRVTGIAEFAGDIFICDARLRAIVKVDPESGARTVLSGPDRGTGPELVVPAYLQADGTELLVLDSGNEAILSVNTATGDRTLISGPERGSGEALSRPNAFTIAGDQLLVTDPGLDAIVAIDRLSGNREIIFQEIIDDNPVILSPQGIAVDSAGIIYVADDQYRLVIRIDREAQRFGIASGGETGEGPEIESPGDLQIDSNNQLLMLDSLSKRIVGIDTLSGDRISLGEGFQVPVALEEADDGWLVADNGAGVVWQLSESAPEPVQLTRVGIGTGPELGSPAEVISVTGGWLIADSANGRLIEVDAGTSARRTAIDGLSSPESLARDINTGDIYVLGTQFNFANISVYDPAAGSVETLTSPSTGSGPVMIDPRQLLIESDRLLVLETVPARILSVDPGSGAREIFAATDVGSGESLSGVTRFALDENAPRLYLLDVIRSRVLQLDLDSGLRTEMLVNDTGTAWQDLVWDETADRLLILGQEDSLILAYDPTTGVLSTLVGSASGRGDLPDNPVSMRLLDQERAAIVDAGLDALFIVDLQTGDRVIVSR